MQQQGALGGGLKEPLMAQPGFAKKEDKNTKQEEKKSLTWCTWPGENKRGAWESSPADDDDDGDGDDNGNGDYNDDEDNMLVFEEDKRGAWERSPSLVSWVIIESMGPFSHNF